MRRAPTVNRHHHRQTVTGGLAPPVNRCVTVKMEGALETPARQSAQPPSNAAIVEDPSSVKLSAGAAPSSQKKGRRRQSTATRRAPPAKKKVAAVNRELPANLPGQKKGRRRQNRLPLRPRPSIRVHIADPLRQRSVNRAARRRAPEALIRQAPSIGRQSAGPVNPPSMSVNRRPTSGPLLPPSGTRLHFSASCRPSRELWFADQDNA